MEAELQEAINKLPVIQKAHIYEPKIEDVAEICFKAGKEECAKTHFKPDWKIKAKDIKDATEESRKATIREVAEWLVSHNTARATAEDIYILIRQHLEPPEDKPVVKPEPNLMKALDILLPKEDRVEAIADLTAAHDGKMAAIIGIQPIQLSAITLEIKHEMRKEQLEFARQICQHLEPPEDKLTVTYTLVCDKCGKVFDSSIAFPSPQLCPDCTPPGDKFEAIKKILDEPVACEDGKSHYIDENHKRYLSHLICHKNSPKDRVEAVKVKLIEFGSSPAVEFTDRDIIFQSESITNFLMHLEILMPDCEFPDEFYIYPTQICQIPVKVKLPRVVSYCRTIDNAHNTDDDIFQAGERYILQQVKEALEKQGIEVE